MIIINQQWATRIYKKIWLPFAIEGDNMNKLFAHGRTDGQTVSQGRNKGFFSS